ncbi:Transcriptional regulatory protein sin3 [Rhizophlyctis rosea]|uniref:Transcriptional regulatory protein sin3 n=1 Tax=Rhizophlyctis rosea TaxID=64517 RepID=A0AAD5X0M5_9FUNG|nr:Transcriptional regulatory protein sin3 [Rhizophlyctis rosea]
MQHHLAPQQSSVLPSPVPASTSVPSTPSTPIHSGPSLAVAEAAASAVSQYRPLNVKDALSYLDQVKIQFSDQPEVYNRFLDIMKDFKSQSIAITSNQIDTPGVIDRVSSLFRGHPNLIMGFNTFLPPGYKIEPTNNPNDPVRVTTPRDHPPYVHHPPPPLAGPSSLTDVASQSAAALSAANTMAGYFGAPGYGGNTGLPSMSSLSGAHSTNGTPSSQYSNSAALGASNIISSMHAHGQSQGGRGGSAGDGSTRRAPVEFNHAINYVNKIKNRFSTEPETYKQFLEILQTYQKEQKPIHDVYAQVQVLFKGAPDLLDEFKQFLPDNSNNQGQGGLGALGRGGLLSGLGSLSNGDSFGGKRPGSAGSSGNQATATPGGKKQHKRPLPGTAGGMLGNGVGSSANGSSISLAQPPKKKAKTAKADKPGNIEELEFFDKCKRLINNRTVYNEFLKVLNLFSQEIIEAKVLLDRIEPFLSKAPELFEWFKRFVKYEEEDIIYNIPIERPHLNIETCAPAGHSYRKLPANWPRPQCSGRDNLCNEVLNDEYISHPMYVSESGFLAHKKTVYEEALHRCEEERYEFDLHIEANLHTIALLEPVAKRLLGMNQEEKNRFTLDADFGGDSKSIYHRAIKKIYDKERGLEIIEALQRHPAVAVPVVLKRLKQKDEEWKRAQRDWNKVWREIDAKNYSKSLDHIGINFKQKDKKDTAPKSLIGQIESIYREQREKPSDKTRYQFDFKFRDQKVFRDVMKLVRLTIKNSGLGEDEGKLLKCAKEFVNTFFVLDEGLEDDGGDGGDSDSEGNDTDTEMEDEMGGASSVARPKVRSNSLRRDVLTRGTGVNGRAGGRANRKSKLSSGDVLETDEDDGAGDGDTESVNDFGARELSRVASPVVEVGSVGGTEGTKEGRDLSVDAMDVDLGLGGSATPTGLVGGSGRSKRPRYSLYANSVIYVFFRLFQMAYGRLSYMKDLSQEMAENPPRADKINPVAVELGLKEANAANKANRDRYAELLQNIHDYLIGETDSNEFEEKARDSFDTNAYLMFTIDKLLQNVVKQLQTMFTDPTSTKLWSLYLADRAQPTTSSRQEATYRYTAESILEDEAMFKLEYAALERVVEIYFFSKDDFLGDHSTSKTDQWSHYIDNYIQINPTDIARPVITDAPHSEPFLKRNLPKGAEGLKERMNAGEVKSRSGLELKICQNSYKMFFVDGTEDWFWRKGDGAGTSGEKEGEDVTGKKRKEKFREFVGRGAAASGTEGAAAGGEAGEEDVFGNVTEGRKGQGRCEVEVVGGKDGVDEFRVFTFKEEDGEGATRMEID